GGEASWDAAANGVQVVEAIERAAACVRPAGEGNNRPAAVQITNRAAQPRHGDVLVIGGTGFIGRRVVRALVEGWHPVRLLARRAGSAASVDGERVAVVQVDVRDADDVSRATEGCKAVIHLVAGAPETWAGFERLFIHGTRHTAEACLRH